MEAGKVMQYIYESAVRFYLLRKFPFQEIDDGFQEILTRSFEFSSRIRSEESLPGVVQAIAKGEVARYYRDPNNHRDNRIPVESLENSCCSAVYDLVSREEDRPDMIVERKQLAALVQEALSLLDPFAAHLLRLKYWEGLSDRRIADHLCIPLGTAKTWLREARKKLKGSPLQRELRVFIE